MRVRITFATAAFVLIASVSAACAQTVPDRVLVGGSILTMDQADTVAQALALDGNRIMAVGSDAQVRALAGPKTQVIDLGGRTVIPGLIDTHIHALRAGQTYEFETYWHDTTSLADGLEQLKAAAIKRGPGKWVAVMGSWVAIMGSWHPAQFVENREPTREDLTEALPDNPAYVQYLYEHATVNDKGIEALNLHDPASLPEGARVERDRNGQPTGKIFGSISSFSALFEKITELEYDQRKNSLRNFFTELNRVGVTGVVDPAGGGSNAASYDPLFALWREKDLSVRVAYRVSAQTGGNEAAWFQSTLAYLPPRLGDEMLKFLGLGELLVFA